MLSIPRPYVCTLRCQIVASRRLDATFPNPDDLHCGFRDVSLANKVQIVDALVYWPDRYFDHGDVNETLASRRTAPL